MINQAKQEYDNAQKLGEKVERMCAQEGWKENFIPTIAKKRDEAQEKINSIKTTEREADYYRGVLSLCDYVLGYELEKINQATTIMRQATKKTVL
jgi:hypothetical protein